ncbi:hypothetical protein D3C76_542440 [compost metagenome]
MDLFADLVRSNAANMKHFVLDWQRYSRGCHIDSVFSGSIKLRNNFSVDFDTVNGIDWAQDFSKNRNVNYLWLYSLDYVGILLDAHSRGCGDKYLDCAITVVESFCRFYCESPENKRKVMYLNDTGSSFDHATSTRSNVLVKYVCSVIGSGRGLDLEPVIGCLHDAALFMVDDKNYSKSNHGTMTDIALSQIGVLAGVGSGIGRVFFEKANDRLIDSVLRTFDADGFANENTIGYHRFNMHLFKSVILNFEGWGVSSRFADVASPILVKAQRALQLCVWPDGSIPPIGDSAVYEKAAESINESMAFLESGLAIVKNDDLYVSVICGRRGDAHKQVDDTSITIRYKNTDIVVDGGHLGYDRLDPYRKTLESSYGHSGIFPDFVEGAAARVYLEMKSEGEICEFADCGESVSIVAKISYPDAGYSVVRTVTVVFPNVILIKDSVLSTNEAVSTTQRLLFGDALTEIGLKGSSQVSLGNDKLKAVVTFGGANAEVSLHHGMKGKEPRGWCSKKAGKKDPCYEVVRSLSGGAFELETRIEIIE